MKALNTLKATLVATAFAALFAGEALADAPNHVRLRSLSYAGSACPAGSVSARISAGRDAFDIIADGFVAEVGPGVPFSAKRKNCQLIIDLDYPSGWSYAVHSFEHRGYASLDRGVKATLQASLYFQGQASTATAKTVLTGPLDRDFVVRDSLGANAQVWSPCGAQRALNINSQIVLSNSANTRGFGLVTIDTGADAPSGLGKLYITWKRCR